MLRKKLQNFQKKTFGKTFGNIVRRPCIFRTSFLGLFSRFYSGHKTHICATHTRTEQCIEMLQFAIEIAKVIFSNIYFILIVDDKKPEENVEDCERARGN